jgi:pimeloyl-ACP methyl ester carboxylesterase
LTKQDREGPATAGPSLLRLPVAGGHLHVEVHGDGSALLLIQGLGYATWAWRRQLPALSARWRAIAFDNRGAGRSAKPPGPYSIELLADDAAAVLDRLGAAPAHVLGLSMGGYVALTLALRRPELVRSLALAGTAAGGPGSLPVPQPTRDAWLAAAGLPPAEYARRTMHLSFAPGWTDVHPDEYEELLTARLEYPTPPECWAAQYAACERFLERGVPAEQIGVPALVWHGDADRVVPVENGRRLADRLPRAELVVWPGGGHLALIEDSDAFNAAVVGFLEGVEA